MATTLKPCVVGENSLGTAASHVSDKATEYGDVLMLSVSQAAAQMGCTPAYVAMLIEAQRLPGCLISSSGQHQIPAPSVEQWRKLHHTPTSDDNRQEAYRKAGLDAGMYAMPDDVYLKVAKRLGRRDA